MKTSLLQKLGNRLVKAAERSRNEEVDYGMMGECPAGVENGIARLTGCGFSPIGKGKKNEGEMMFFARGTVVSPKELDGAPIEGLVTSIMEPFFDTPGRARESFEDHVAWVQNELKKLGATPYDLGGEQLEETCQMLVEAQPFFRFRTWKGKKQTTGPYKDMEPRTNHVWQGIKGLESYVPEDSGEEVEDNTEEARTAVVKQGLAVRRKGVSLEDMEEATRPFRGTAKAPLPQPPNGKARAGKPKAKPEPEPFTEDGVEGSGEVDIDALLERANNGDDNAQQELTDVTLRAGVPVKKVDSADDWDAVAALYRAAAKGQKPVIKKPVDVGSEEDEGEEVPAAEEGEEDGADYAPEKDDVVTYTPPGAKKPAECDVVAVDVKGKTCTLKNLGNQKQIWKGIPWSKVAPIEG